MLRSFRKRFMLLTMLLTGSVLLCVLLAVGIYMHYDYYYELESTMLQVLEYQHDHITERSKKPDEPGRRDAAKPDVPNDAPNMPDDGPEKKPPEKSKDIITVFYYKDTDEISIGTNNTDLGEEAFRSAVKAAVVAEKSYGILYDQDLIYCVEGENGEYKIAFTDIWYIWESMMKLIAILSLIFVGSLLLFFLISNYTSKVAMKPLEKAMEQESRFVADVSHELKTPLTVILANTGILKENEGLGFEQQIKWIDSTENAAHRMMDMINEMLTLSFLECAENKPELRQMNLSSTAMKAFLQMESVAYDKNIEYTQDISEYIRILGDVQLTERVCTSLIDNALKYEPEGGKISVRLFAQKKKAVLEIANYGSFIPEEHISHIFDRFYRTDKSRSQSKGYGLGLSIVKQSVALLNGDISVESAEGKGTVFKVVFTTSE